MNQLTHSLILHYNFDFFSTLLEPDKTCFELEHLLRTAASFCGKKQKINKTGFFKSQKPQSKGAPQRSEIRIFAKLRLGTGGEGGVGGSTCGKFQGFCI